MVPNFNSANENRARTVISAFIKAMKCSFCFAVVKVLTSLQMASVTLSTKYLCRFVFKYSDLYKMFNVYSIVYRIYLRKNLRFLSGCSPDAYFLRISTRGELCD